ncbi:CCM1 [Acrasis kona]|uniref:CCM1 n=1 Tax=Acrasis kona TaxID=1008807 RepID=A0AAW2ZEK9_9EUKA
MNLLHVFVVLVSCATYISCDDMIYNYASCNHGGSITPKGRTTSRTFMLYAYKGYNLLTVLVNGHPQKVFNNTVFLPSNEKELTVTAFFSPQSKPNDYGQNVGILYETWFNAINAGGFRPVYPEEVPSATYRYWGEPAVGRYNSDDERVINIHADLLAASAMDYIIVDYSNNNILDPSLHNPVYNLLNIYQNRAQQGIPTPQIVFLLSASDNQVALLRDLYNRYNHKIFYHLNNKPLLFPTKPCTIDGCDFFENREMWGLLPQGDNRYSFMQLYPQNIVNGNEQIAVSAAQQETYMSLPSAHSRKYDFRTGGNTGGDFQNFDDQWQRAIDNKVRTVTIKAWNEWVAIKFEQGYTDQFNADQSNDIEPVRGRFGDAYYNRMKQWIGRFKSL